MLKHGCDKSEKPIARSSEPVPEPRNRTLKVSAGTPSSKVTKPSYEPKYSVVEFKDGSLRAFPNEDPNAGTVQPGRRWIPS
jgi:hypothetical protein